MEEMDAASVRGADLQAKADCVLLPGVYARLSYSRIDTMTPGMKDPRKNSYLTMPLPKLRSEISALEKTVHACAGSVGPRLDGTMSDANRRLKFAFAALSLRGEVR
jgi:hypothetical protein